MGWFRRRRPAPPAHRPVWLRISADGCPGPLLFVDLELLEAMALAEPGDFEVLSTDELRPGTVVRITLEHS